MIGNSGGVNALVRVLQAGTHSTLAATSTGGRADLKRLAAATLACLAANPAVVVSSDAIGCLVELLYSDPAAELQVLAAQALSHLARHTPASRVTMVSCGGVEALVAILKAGAAVEQGTGNRPPGMPLLVHAAAVIGELGAPHDGEEEVEEEAAVGRRGPVDPRLQIVAAGGVQAMAGLA